MYCKNCGNQLDDEVKFCAKCGKSVSVENINKDNKSQLPKEGKETGSVTRIPKRLAQIVSVIFFLLSLSAYSSRPATQFGSEFFEVILNIFNITAGITFIVLIVEWLKNFKKGKKWFGWRWITFLIVLSLVGFGTMIFSQALIVARQKAIQSEATNNVNDYFTDNSTWKDFDSTSAQFHATFPVYPSHETIPLNISGIVGIVDADTYRATQPDGTGYAISYANYGSKINTSVPENNLEGSVNGTVQAIKGTLISSSFSDFGTYKAIDFVIYQKANDLYAKGKNILVGQSIYQIIVIYETKNAENVQYDKFINSFQIK